MEEKYLSARLVALQFLSDRLRAQFLEDGGVGRPLRRRRLAALLQRRLAAAGQSAPLRLLAQVLQGTLLHILWVKFYIVVRLKV